MTDRKIVDYKMLIFTTANEASEIVNIFIMDGWQPFGSPGSVEGHGFQAMVKYEDIKETYPKDFREYLIKRLTKDEIEKIEKEAKEEFKLMLKFSRLCGEEI